MPTLLIKTKDGKVYRDKFPIHAIMVMELGINPDDVVDKGIVVKGQRDVWVGSSDLN